MSQREPFFDPAISRVVKRSGHVDAQGILQRSAALEQALRDSEELYRSTFELAAVGVAHVNPDGRWLRLNRKFCEIAGYEQEEILKLKFQDITHPDDLAAPKMLTVCRAGVAVRPILTASKCSRTRRYFDM